MRQSNQMSQHPNNNNNSGTNNSGKTNNHESINDQCNSGNKMIDDDNQRNLNLKFYEIRRYYNQSETNMMSVYQRGDSVSNQPLTLPLTVVYPPQQITTPFFSGVYYVVAIFQYRCPNCCSDVSKYVNV